MKTLETIQKLSKIGKILSKISFILSTVCAGLCALSLVAGELLKWKGVTLYKWLGAESGEATAVMAMALAGWLILLAGEAVLAKFAERYFHHELAAGTPFTLEGARELQRLGILTIAVPIGCEIVSAIVQGIIGGFMDVVKDADKVTNAGFEGQVALGIMFIVAALICRYGAESRQG